MFLFELWDDCYKCWKLLSFPSLELQIVLSDRIIEWKLFTSFIPKYYKCENIYYLLNSNLIAWAGLLNSISYPYQSNPFMQKHSHK